MAAMRPSAAATRALLRSTATPSSMLVSRTSTQRCFQTSARLCETPTAALPLRKPVGAFRGGLLGFLTGCTTAGAGLYYYVIDDYKVSNELLTEDIYALQSAVQRIEGYVKTLEEKVK